MERGCLTTPKLEVRVGLLSCLWAITSAHFNSIFLGLRERFRRFSIRFWRPSAGQHNSCRIVELWVLFCWQQHIMFVQRMPHLRRSCGTSFLRAFQGNFSAGRQDRVASTGLSVSTNTAETLLEEYSCNLAAEVRRARDELREGRWQVDEEVQRDHDALCFCLAVWELAHEASLSCWAEERAVHVSISAFIDDSGPGI